MKRKALLAVTGCTVKAFETYAYRDFLPFAIADARWSDYTLENAFALKVLMEAAAVTDVASASIFAGGVLDALRPLDPFSYMGDEEIWLALIRYDWRDAPEDWTNTEVVAGRWRDIDDKCRALIADTVPGAKVTSIIALSATKIADSILREARDLGLPEAEVRPVPEDLTGYPEWFKESEGERRDLLTKWGSDE